MEIRVIGDLEDAIGFALAGVQGRVCEQRSDVIAALRACEQDPSVALVVVSAATARLAPEAVEESRNRTGLPITLVLPAGNALDDTPAEVRI